MSDVEIEKGLTDFDRKYLSVAEEFVRLTEREDTTEERCEEALEAANKKLDAHDKLYEEEIQAEVRGLIERWGLLGAGLLVTRLGVALHNEVRTRAGVLDDANYRKCEGRVELTNEVAGVCSRMGEMARHVQSAVGRWFVHERTCTIENEQPTKH